MFKKEKEVETTTLEKYKIVFKTVDGECHEFHGMEYCDKAQISCSPGEYYMIGKEYLKDDDGQIYPINNIIKIKFEKISEIQNVIQKSYNLGNPYVFYGEKDITIYDSKSFSENGHTESVTEKMMKTIKELTEELDEYKSRYGESL